ncbi:MAG: hypothetical protein Q7R97_02805 [Candidatus Daviesbacteria bacterium]|nr:hypothetical protein [Candidatus Daviesbacteria bacterium]
MQKPTRNGNRKNNIEKVREALENPTVKNVLLLLGVGTFVAASLIIPTLPMASKPIIDLYKKKQREKEQKKLDRFNQWRLHQTLKRLYAQKVVEIIEENGEYSIKLSSKGQTKFLRYKLEEIMIDHPPKWDGKWRLIIYDVPKGKRIFAENFRRLLKKIECLKLQKSVYLAPYPCDKQIEFLRQYYDLSEEVLYLVVAKLENEKIYKTYFGL